MSYNMEYLDINYLQTKYKTNKLLSAILYVYNSCDENEQFIIKSINDYCVDKGLHINTIRQIILATLHIYNSRLLQYNLPHMLNNNLSKGTPAFHIVFGECMTQLLSIMLTSESLDIILNVKCEDAELKIIIEQFTCKVLNDNLDLDINIKNEDLNNDMEEFIKQIIDLSKLLIDKL